MCAESGDECCACATCPDYSVVHVSSQFTWNGGGGVEDRRVQKTSLDPLKRSFRFFVFPLQHKH